MTNNGIHPDFRKRYSELKDELKRLNSEKLINKVQVIVLEQTIFKTLPRVCMKCGSDKNLTLDHIIPKMILADLGVDVENEIIEDNYQVLCRYCNTKKGSRLDIREKGVKELLLKVINRS